MTSPSQPFLIPPFDRYKFTVLFLLATSFGWFLIWLLLHSVQDPVFLNYLDQRGLLAVIVTGFVAGMVVCAMQWLVLQSYLSDWLWILAGATGYVLLTFSLETWWGWVGQILTWPEVITLVNKFSPMAMPLVSGILRMVLTMFCSLWLGLAQWVVLRQYVRSSGWWIWVPSIAVLISSIFAACNTLLPHLGIYLPLETNVLGAGILGLTQAIAFCTLRKNNQLVSHGNLFPNIPEILDYGKLQSLAKQLHRQLKQSWIIKHPYPVSLTYQVAVTDRGAIAAYQPVNQPAVEQINHTPLPDLTVPESGQPINGKPPALARFEVTFLPSGNLQIQAWRGVPLVWIAIGMLIMVLAISAIAARFGTLLLDTN